MLLFPTATFARKEEKYFAKRLFSTKMSTFPVPKSLGKLQELSGNSADNYADLHVNFSS